MIIVCAILGGIVLPVVLILKFANNERIRRGEQPKKYHDLTDLPAPVDVIVCSDEENGV